jgi:lipopolysaccharide/colanic/teichoic acid biosynthesis glycosyltransferase
MCRIADKDRRDLITVTLGWGDFMRFLSLLLDLLLIAVATVLALFLRDNFELSQAKLIALTPYLILTLTVAATMLPVFGVSRSVWQFTAMTDYLRIVFATIVTVIGALALGFVVNRLDGIARALPVLQALIVVFFLVGIRILMRLRHAARVRRVHLPNLTPIGAEENVLVIGLNKVAELYLHCVAEFMPHRIKIAGLLDRSEHIGVSINSHRVLGTPENIAQSLRELEVHGVFVDRIVLAVPFANLSEQAQHALLEVEKATTIRLDFLTDRIGFDVGLKGSYDANSAFFTPTQNLSVDPALTRSPYWTVKRALDIAASSVALILLMPIMLVVSALVALDVGRPVIFWQQRPGRGGRLFKLYKFRTMASAHNDEGWPVPEADRLSAIGRLLRRTRADELPQLYNILMGEMSFTGPRPLLPVDQPDCDRSRLLVRPGLTGWAQINGGRHISVADKTALDLWYVQNASLWLDLEIMTKTLAVLIRGERRNTGAIRRATLELARASSA